MKVLMLKTGSSNPDHQRLALRRNKALLPLLRERGVDLSLYTLVGRGNPHAIYREIPVPSGTLRGDPLIGLPRGIWNLTRVLKGGNFDLIHADEPIPAVAAGIARRIAKRELPLTYFRHHTRGRLRLQKASRMAARLSDHTMVFSDAVASFARLNDGTPPERIAKVECGIPDPRPVSGAEITAAKTSLGLSPDAVVVGAVSRLRPEKNLQSLILAMQPIFAKESNVHLLLVGDGPEAARLHDIAKLGEPGRVSFVGNQDDVDLWYSICDCVCMPSIKEGLGVSAIEAMALSRPVIASAVDGLKEVVVHEVNGLHVASGDVSELTNAIERLTTDSALRHQLGRGALESFRNRHSIVGMADSIVGVWASLMRAASDG